MTVELRRDIRWRAAIPAVLSGLLFAACSGVIADSSNETLPPLVPANTGPLVTQVQAVGPDGNPVVNTQGSTTTFAGQQDPAAIASNDADPTSVAARFLASVASNEASIGSALEMPGRTPTVFDWARGAYQQYTQLAGAGSWGTPTCAEPSGSSVTCSWLQTDAAPTLMLMKDGDSWRVSHPVFTGPAQPATVGSGCVVGSSSVNFRGGPGTSWPRFTQINPGDCSLTVFGAVENDPVEGGQWRYVERDGQRGWIVDRVLQIS